MRAEAADVRAPAQAEPRGTRRPALWELGVLAAHGTLLVWVLAHHEPWFDEAQAWLLARDASVLELLWKYPRYEGSPALWHVLLAIPAKLGAPYVTLKVVAGAAAFISAALVVLRSPFPAPLRAVLPFSFWLFYQYGVVARSYVLLAPLLFAVAIAWPGRAEKPVRLGVLLFLLANVSFHGFLVAGGVLAVHIGGLRGRWPTLSTQQRRGHASVAAGFAALAVVLYWQLRMPVDASFAGAGQLDLDVTSGARESAQLMSAAFTGSAWTLVLGVFPTLLYLAKARAFVLWLVPTATALAFSVVRYGNKRQGGVLVVVWIFALWCGWPPRESTPRVRVPRGWTTMATAGIGVVVLVQASWTVRTARFDLREPYSGAAATAAYLRDRGAIASRVHTRSIESTSVQPYFRTSIWDNYNDGRCPCFWWWSDRVGFDGSDVGILSRDPDAIIYGDKAAGSPDPLPRPKLSGYHVDAYFRGALFVKDRILEQDGFWVFVPNVSSR